jgi:DNA-binding Lrp family transcriptional regulator
MGTRREALAAEIRAERARQNIPFGVLAEKAGMSTDTLRRRLTGVRPSTSTNLN